MGICRFEWESRPKASQTVRYPGESWGYPGGSLGRYPGGVPGVMEGEGWVGAGGTQEAKPRGGPHGGDPPGCTRELRLMGDRGWVMFYGIRVAG